MAHDAIAFIRALGFDQVDLLGFSLGGFLAQVIALEEPQLVRKVILAGTGPKERTQDRDKATSISTLRAQLKAIHAWGRQEPADLSSIQHPVLVANGDQDAMVPNRNSTDLARRLPHADWW